MFHLRCLTSKTRDVRPTASPGVARSLRALSSALVALATLAACDPTGVAFSMDGDYPSDGGGYSGGPLAPDQDAGESAPDGGPGAADGGNPAQDGGTGAADGGTPAQDGGTPARDGGTPARDGGTGASEWLRTEGRHILRADGSVWRGRGANVHDTRGCDACAWDAPSPDGVKKRIDVLVDDWKANFLRLTLESYAASEGRTHWASFTQDSTYLRHLHEIVDHAKSKPGVYVMLSLWIDPTFTDMGWPSAATTTVWERLAEEFVDEPRVLFGLVNEPESNFSGQYDVQVWTAMNATVQAIRDVEARHGTQRHVIAVQGTGGWSRRLGYYVTKPITAGGGANVAYEVHVYDPASDFPSLFESPSQTLPVIIGEFGPAVDPRPGLVYMTEADCSALIASARQRDIPHLAWTFHHNCQPNLVTVTAVSGSVCGANVTITPTSWGTLLRNALAVPW